jgi:F-type H+-transporting ATPase subunit b
VNITATLIGQMLTFAVLIWFIKAVLWEPMLNMLEDRKKRIADGLAAAERGQHEQHLAQERAKGTLREVKQQAAEVLAKAERRAGEIIDEAKETAKEEGERIKTAAQAEIDQEVNRARETLRKEVSSVALQGAERILGKEVDAAAHGKVLDDLVAQI